MISIFKKIALNNTKYYEIMGLEKNATPQDIRKAFRKFNRYHPKKTDLDRVKEINNSYEILRDPKKREIYGKYGEEGLNNPEILEDYNPFNSIFNFINQKKCGVKFVKLNITLEDAYNGRRKEVEYDKKIICPKCKGGTKITCVKCNSSGFGIQQKISSIILQTKCDECYGRGKIIKDTCEECKGKRVQNIKRKIGIDLDRGVPDRHKYKMANVGDEFPDIEAGDLIIEIFLQEHKDFIRKGADLWYKCKISLYEALTGVKEP